MTKLIRFTFALFWVPLMLTSFIQISPEAESPKSSIVKLRLMETTDLHGYLLPYSYFNSEAKNRYGLALTATLIKQARSKMKNSMLFDNGDILKGSLLDEYIHYKGLKKGETHPAYQAMNLLDYDAATVGNHEFNFGLDFMNEAINDTNFPFVSANIYYDDGDSDPENDRHYFKPYLILPRTFIDQNGQKQTIKVGVIGFTLPQTVPWNRRYGRLQGIIKVKDIYQTAKKYVPEMKKKGADIIVALSHSGLGTPEIKFKEANASYDLSKIDGINAILFGHVHRVFPSDDFANIPGVNLKKGTVNGVAAVEAGHWGSHLGVIDLTLKKDGENWKVVRSQSEARPIYGKNAVSPDPRILHIIKNIYKGLWDYSFTPEGVIWGSKQK